MSFSQFSLRRCRSVTRMVLFCCAFAVLLLAGCSSQSSRFDESGHYNGATGSVPTPSEPVYGNGWSAYNDGYYARRRRAAGYRRYRSTASYDNGVRRDTLPPVEPRYGEGANGYDGYGSLKDAPYNGNGYNGYHGDNGSYGNGKNGRSRRYRYNGDNGYDDANGSGGLKDDAYGPLNGDYGSPDRVGVNGHNGGYGDNGNGNGNGDEIYVVRRGDTLYGIARRFGVDHRELAAYNDLADVSLILPGQRLRIPSGNGRAQYGGAPVVTNQAVAVGPAGRKPVRYAARQTPRIISDAAPPAVHAPRARAVPPKPYAAADEPPPRRRPAPRDEEAIVEGPDDIVDEPEPEPVKERDHIARGPDIIEERPSARQRDCDDLLANPIPRSGDNFREPVQGAIISRFGEGENGSVNDGINYAVPRGTPVKAAENGVVAYAGDELAGFGKLVLIRHADGFVSAYAHNDRILVKRCDIVKRGQEIAKAGATGAVTQPQLHFELRRDSTPVDPLRHFASAP